MTSKQPDRDHPIYKMIDNILSQLYLDLSKGQVNYDSAIPLLTRQLEVAQKVGHRILEAQIYQLMGILESERGHYKDGLEHFESNLTISREIDDKRRETTALCAIGEVYRHVGDIEKSAQHFAESRQLAESLDYDRLVIFNYCNEGQLWITHDDLKRGIELLEQGIELAESLDWESEIQRELIPEMRNGLAQAYAKQGEFDKAWKLARRSLEITRDAQKVKHIAHSYQTMAIIAMEQHLSTDDVISYFKKSREYWSKMGANSELAELYTVEGDFWSSRKKHSIADKCYETAAMYYEKLQNTVRAEAVREKISH